MTRYVYAFKSWAHQHKDRRLEEYWDKRENKKAIDIGFLSGVKHD